MADVSSELFQNRLAIGGWDEIPAPDTTSTISLMDRFPCSCPLDTRRKGAYSCQMAHKEPYVTQGKSRCLRRTI